MRIFIAGGGNVGQFLVDRLYNDHDLTVIEQRAEKAEKIRAMYPNVRVITGDACEPSILEHTGIEDADVLAAVTGDDEDNLVISLLSKMLGVDQVFARVNHPRNEWMFTSDWGVDVPVSSAAIMYGLMEKEIGLGDIITLLRLQAANVSIEEITLPAECEAISKRLADVQLPPNTQVMAVIPAAGGVTVARGDTILNPGDQLLLLSDGASDTAIRNALGLSCPMPESGG